jgi:formylglycine-generating enzyme required for sulfatase activity
MGGSGPQNDAPEVSVNMSSFQISEKEITNEEYVSFLNQALAYDWVEIKEEQVSDPCGVYVERLIMATDEGAYPGEIYLQLAETGGCTSEGEIEHINNKSWIVFDEENQIFTLLSADKADWPVNWIKWYGAHAFCLFFDLELPTEAQWEYAAKGGQNFQYATDDGTLDTEKANYNGDVPGVYNPEGHCIAVGSYPPNPFGLYDMSGNVWEWCLDYYDASFYKEGESDPVNINPASENKRVRRGGSWNYHSASLQSFARASDLEERGNNHFGFRAVKNN